MAKPAIEIERLTKDYPVGFWRKKMRRSLDHLTLQVEEGESFGFLGPNGAGKTTTMKLLMGLIFPTSGSARVRGRSINDVRMHREIGYMPEQPYFYDYLTARELLGYFARFFGFNAAERKERVARFLSLVGLAGGAARSARYYSGFEAAGPHDFLFHAHSFRCGNVVRPCGGAGRRKIARDRFAGGNCVHGSAGHGNPVRGGQGTDAAA